MLNRFLDGYNVTFMAYGQTGTGKTHTMFGSQLGEVKNFETDSEEMPKQWGLFPRALISALDRIKVMSSHVQKTKLRISFDRKRTMASLS